MNIEKLISKFKEIHGDKYEYSKEINKFKIDIYCKNCKNWFIQNIYKHKNGHNCPTCVGGVKIDTEEFIKRAISKFGNEFCDYSNVNYINTSTKVKLKCKLHNYFFYQTPQNHMSKIVKSGCKGCPLCSKNTRLTNEEFIKISMSIFNNMYDYSEAEYLNQNSIIKLKCKLHNYEFKQEASAILIGKIGCIFCRDKANFYNTDLFIKNSNLKHNNRFTYDKTIFKSMDEDIIITCKKHGDFNINAKSHIRGKKCPKCVSSNGEFKIIHFLENNKIDFVHQKSFNDCKDKNILRFDFYLYNINTIIEFDGIQHYKISEKWGGKDKLLDNIKKDNIKNIYCIDNNIKLIRISYHEYNNIEIILKNSLLNEN